MEPLPQGWRTVGDDSERGTRAARGPAPGTRQTGGAGWSAGPMVIALVLFACGLVAAAAVVVVAVSAAPSEVVIDGADVVGVVRPPESSAAIGSPDAALALAPELVVDVEGAVGQPGLYRVAAGSRVGDAIAAAGGFGPRVDAEAAARTLNLASPLTDGDKVHVPSLGEMAGAVPADGAVSGAPTAPGLIDLNTAGSTELDTLPGIGPVTAAAIIAARETLPFTSVDDLQSRGVVGPATFEKIRSLVTVGG